MTEQERKELQAAREAKDLHESPAFQSVLATLEAEYTMGWKIAATPDERERFWHAVNTISDIRIEIEKRIGRGQVAASRQKDDS